VGKNFFAFGAGALLIFLVLCGCGASGGGGGGGGGGVTPEVLDVTPPNACGGVVLTPEVTATFSTTMDSTTISTSTFMLASAEGAVSGTVTYNASNKMATFTPAADLAYGVTYTATVAASVKSADGMPMAAAYTWSFTTKYMWENYSIDDTPYAIDFPSATVGYAAGADGVIIKTVDGGTSWVSQESGENTPLSGVSFVSSTRGWVVGYDPDLNTGFILDTTDGGTNWSRIKTTTEWLYGVYFVNENVGWVVGAGGKILKTADGGASFEAQTSYTTEQLHAVYFVDSTTGWVVGNTGTILKTTDGGASWVAQDSASSENLQAVYFLNSVTGFAVGANGTILRTINGGANWTAQTTGITNYLYGVCFYTTTAGFAVGQSGIILQTADLGETWTSINSPAIVYLWGISAYDASHLWIAGSHMILVYDP
jgi:photosystem II stability/assembly factor-like uncharacterized protein